MKTSKTIIFSSLMVVTIFLAGCSNKKDNNLNSISDIKNETPQIEEPVPSENKSANKDSAEKFEPEENINSNFLSNEDVEIEAIDENWAFYENIDLGFKIKYPKNIWTISTYTLCEEDDQGRFKKPIQRLEVPLSFFVDDKVVYVAEEYFFRKTENQKCEKVVNSLNSVIGADIGWKMTFANINNDNELEDFVKQQYGKGCSVSGKEESKEVGVYDISVIDSTGQGMIAGECILNFKHVLKYSPVLKKAVQWNIGQDCNFGNNKEVSLDFKMTESFEFIKK